VSPALTALNSDALLELRNNLAQLKQAFVGVSAPKQSALDVAAVTDRVDKIAAVAGALR